jgi:hypothetical protein
MPLSPVEIAVDPLSKIENLIIFFVLEIDWFNLELIASANVIVRSFIWLEGGWGCGDMSGITWHESGCHIREM